MTYIMVLAFILALWLMSGDDDWPGPLMGA